MYDANKGFPVGCFLKMLVTTADGGILIFVKTINYYIKENIYKVPA